MANDYIRGQDLRIAKPVRGEGMMFFVLSKIFWAIFTPLTFISLLICGGFVMRRFKWGQRVMGTGIALLVLCGFFPVGHNLLVYQETRYPVMTALPAHVDGVIILGAAIDFKKSLAWGQGQLNEHASRVTEMIFLMQHYPKARIVFTGGNGKYEKSLSSEAVELDKLLKHLGFDTSRIIYERESRNTFENMNLSKEKLHPQKGEIWLLVTSAFHMQRSVETFISNGWDVIPYPAGYLTEGDYKLIPNFEVLTNMYKLQIAAKEMIGIMAYHLSGKIKSNETIDPLPVSFDASGHSSSRQGR